MHPVWTFSIFAKHPSLIVQCVYHLSVTTKQMDRFEKTIDIHPSCFAKHKHYKNYTYQEGVLEYGQ